MKENIEIEKIVFISQERETSTFFLYGGESIEVYEDIDTIENNLNKHGFIKANHKMLVNTEHIHSISEEGKRIITLSNNYKIKISRRKIFQFKLIIIRSHFMK